MQEKGENIPTTIKENTLQRINNNEWKVQVLSQQVLVLGKGAWGFSGFGVRCGLRFSRV